MYKKTIRTGMLVTAFCLFILSLYSFINRSSETSSTPAPVITIYDNEFMIGAMDVGWDMYYANIPQLHFNAWHKYSGAVPLQWNAQGWPNNFGVLDPNDRYQNPLSSYSANVIDRIGQNRSHGMRSIMDRPKTLYTALGQRSDYQCEPENVLADPDYWFYTYNTHETGIPEQDNTSHGDHQKVMHCRTIPTNLTEDAPGYAVKGLRANHEQANKWWNIWQSDSVYKWYVMPRIRILTGLPDNTPVCRVQVLNWNGDTVAARTIFAANFNDNNNNYDGKYLEEFFWNHPSNDPPSAIEVQPGDICPWNPGTGNKSFITWENSDIYTDYRVYWYGQCDIWIDYVRVENLPAHQLFKGVWDQQIQEETDLALTGSTNGGYVPNIFYNEEFEFNHIPCIGYVNKIIKQYAATRGVELSLMVNLNYPLFRVHEPDCWNREVSAPRLKKYLVDSGGVNTIVNVSYPMEGWQGNEPVREELGDHSMSLPVSEHPNTLSTKQYNRYEGILSVPVSPADYETWLQQKLDFGGGAADGFIKIMKKCDTLSKDFTDLRLIHLLQGHMWWATGHKLKEASNEELDVMANLAVSYGAKGILYFWYGCTNEYDVAYDSYYTRGLTGDEHPTLNLPRTYNVYGQEKWTKIAGMNQRLGIWGSAFMGFNNTDRRSYVYRDPDERSALFSNSYFADVVSYKWGTGVPPCQTDSPESTYTGASNNYQSYECQDERFLQVATFKKSPDDGNKYFMIVNRRCSPYQDETSEDHRGGKRYVRIRFDPNSEEFSGYSNWKIIDLETKNEIVIFVKTYTGLLDLGWFMPGEGKLYEITPALKSGGTLAGDEIISGQTFTCAGNIYNDGHNITIGANTHISFTDTSKIIMTGGAFTVGNANNNGSENITFDSPGGGTNWHGYDFNNTEVRIYNSTFSKTANDTISAINLIDCPFVDIRGNTFNTESNTLQGCINAVYYNAVTSLNQNFYIGGNTFNSNASTVPALSVSDYAGITMPVLIENNNFNSTSSGTTALLLSGVTSGAVKSNTITDYSIGLNLLSTSTDVYNNTISSSLAGSTGIYGTAGSELNMNASGEVILGGLNNILLTGSGSRDMLVENSFFDIDNGQNIFELSEASASSHLTGYFPYSLDGYRPDARDNCFKVDGSMYAPPVSEVLNGTEGEQIVFTFEPYLTGCSQEDAFAEYVINLGNGIYDTLGLLGGGNGGSKSSVTTELRSVKNTTGQRYIFDLHKTYDSICVAMRKHNYAYAKSKCFNMIDMFTDSLESLAAISKLYLAVIASDTTQSAVSNLKTYYETLILNHSTNTSLVRRCNYFVQKCKVKLHQYSSAMAGFNEIINQNPYGYEGLLARWDYMATSLLINGQGGGEKNDPILTKEGTNGWFEDSYEPDGDKSPFTKEERSAIRQNVSTALITGEKREREKIKILEERSNNGDERAKQELRVAKSLKEIVKTEKPKNIIEHVKIVSGDVQKIFGSGGKSVSKSQNNIPTVFKLYQNYPNPFNPVCVIKYDIPSVGTRQGAFVLIKIYDIIGREVKTLVNEFKKAGSYSANFDGSMYASGVYLYRIEAGEFVESKKMVLVK